MTCNKVKMPIKSRFHEPITPYIPSTHSQVLKNSSKFNFFYWFFKQFLKESRKDSKKCDLGLEQKKGNDDENGETICKSPHLISQRSVKNKLLN